MKTPAIPVSEQQTDYLLSQILIELKGIHMDTTALKTAFSGFSTAFGTFATDFQNYLTKQAAAADTPQELQDVQDITTGLSSLQTNVQQMDAIINPPASGTPNPPIVPNPGT